MKKIFIYLILLLNAVVLFGQQKLELRLIYEVKLKQHNKNKNLKSGQKQFNKIAKESGKKTLILDVKNDESFFYLNSKMESDSNKKFDLLSAFIGNNKYYYNSSENSSITEKNSWERTLLLLKNQIFVGI